MSEEGQSGRLTALAADARAAGKLALDTEFMGEGRYRTLLCLVQLAIPEGMASSEHIAVIDPLEDDLDGSALAAVLADPAVEIVVHAGRQDIALMRRCFQTDVTNVFDTQVAAGFAGLGAQASYDSLLADILGLRVAKTASFTRWDARPLSSEQMAYAREDVVHLLELAAELERRLSALVARAGQRLTLLARLPRVNGLSATARPIARELVEWREDTAERQNRTVQSVLSDATLVEIARRRPSSPADLQKIRGVGSAGNARRAQDVLGAVERGAERPPDPPPQSARAPTPKPDDVPMIALGEALLRARAREAGLAYELLAARADLQAIVTAFRTGGEEADVRTLRGWRRELAGAELLRLLGGEISLSVNAAGAGPRIRIEEREDEQ